MTSGIDRAVWAAQVAALVARFDRGNKSAFSRRIGFTTRTIDRWLARQVDVKIETVRAVAETLRLSPRETTELLTAIGFYVPVPPSVPDPYGDPVIKAIMEDGRWTEEERADLVKEQIARIEADFVRRIEEYQRLVRLRSSREAS